MLKMGSNAVTQMAMPLPMLLLRNQTQRLASVPSSLKFYCSSSSSSSSTVNNPRKLILYSKPGCCLCDGLKEKLNVAFSLSGPNYETLHDVELQIRDITTNPEWERAYQYEIPVLAKLRPDGSEETLPRLSPRIGAELIQRKIADAFRQ